MTGLGIEAGSGVGVEHPLEGAVAGDDEVGIAVEPEERQCPARSIDEEGRPQPVKPDGAAIAT